MLELNGFVQVLLFGLFGGCIAEFIRWYGIRDSPDYEVYKKTMMYWLLTFAMIIIGGVWTTLYGTQNISAIMAVNLGASAPALIFAAVKAGSTPGAKQPLAPQPKNTELYNTSIAEIPRQLKPSVVNFLAGR